LPNAAGNPELDCIEGVAPAAQGMHAGLDAVQSRHKIDASLALVLRAEQKAAALHATSSLARLMLLESGLNADRTEIETDLILQPIASVVTNLSRLINTSKRCALTAKGCPRSPVAELARN
jgi:hypothetical protein